MTTRTEPGGGIPPSASRLRAAAGRGRFPRSRLLAAGLALLAAAVVLPLAGEAVATGLVEAFHNGLGHALPERSEPASALTAAAILALGCTLLLLAAPALTSLVVNLAIALRARRAGGSTTVPLPPEKSGESSPAAPRLAALFLVIPAVLWTLGRHRDLAAAWMAGDPGLADGLGSAVAELLAGVGSICVLAGIAELALARSRLRSALSLSRSEAARERRAQRGDGRSRGDLDAARLGER